MDTYIYLSGLWLGVDLRPNTQKDMYLKEVTLDYMFKIHQLSSQHHWETAYMTTKQTRES